MAVCTISLSKSSEKRHQVLEYAEPLFSHCSVAARRGCQRSGWFAPSPCQSGESPVARGVIHPAIGDRRDGSGVASYWDAGRARLLETEDRGERLIDTPHLVVS